MRLKQFRQLATAAVCAMTASSGASAQEPPTPQVFAPGVVSSGAIDGAPTFAPDGRTLLFERTNSKWVAILQSRLTARGWSNPQLASFSGETSDQQPAFAPDGKYLIFVSSRPITGDTAGKFASHLFRVDRDRQGWSRPIELPAQVNISNSVYKPTIAANHDLYFMSDTGGGTGARVWRLFVAKRSGSGYEQARPLPFTQDGDVDPFIAPDQSYLIFSSNTRAGADDKNEHLYIVRRAGDSWGEVKRIRYQGDDWGADDGEAQVGPDGTTLYFTSTRVTPMPRVRDRGTAVEALKRMNVWDNSNSNVWTLPLAPYLR